MTDTIQQPVIQTSNLNQTNPEPPKSFFQKTEVINQPKSADRVFSQAQIDELFGRSPEGEAAEGEAKETPEEGAQEAATQTDKPKAEEGKGASRKAFLEAAEVQKAKQAVAAQEEALKAEKEEVKGIKDILSTGKEAPHKVLKALGWEVNDFLQAIVDGKLDISSSEGAAKELSVKEQVKLELEAAMKQKEAADKQLEIDKQQKAIDEGLKNIKVQINDYLKANDKDYPLAADGNADVVFEVWLNTVTNPDEKLRNVNYTYQEAVKAVNEYELAKLQKYQGLLSNKVKDNKSEEKDNSVKKSIEKPKTLTNKMGLNTSEVVSEAQPVKFKSRAEYEAAFLKEMKATRKTK